MPLTINECLGTEADPHKLSLGGVDYLLSPTTKKTQGTFEKLLRSRGDDSAIETAAGMRRKARDAWKKAEQLQLQLDDPKISQSTANSLEEERQEAVAEAQNYDAMSKEHLEDHNISKTAGHYEHNGRVYHEALRTEWGSVQLFYMMLLPNHKDMTWDKARQLHEDHNEEVINGIREVEGIGGKKPEMKEEKKSEPE